MATMSLNRSWTSSTLSHCSPDCCMISNSFFRSARRSCNVLVSFLLILKTPVWVLLSFTLPKVYTLFGILPMIVARSDILIISEQAIIISTSSSDHGTIVILYLTGYVTLLNSVLSLHENLISTLIPFILPIPAATKAAIRCASLSKP